MQRYRLIENKKSEILGQIRGARLSDLALLALLINLFPTSLIIAKMIVRVESGGLMCKLNDSSLN